MYWLDCVNHSHIWQVWPYLFHWVTHICVTKLTIIGADISLLPGWRQAIIWTNVGILLIGPLGANFSEIFIENYTFSFKKIHLKNVIWKWQPFCLCLNVLIYECYYSIGNQGLDRSKKRGNNRIGEIGSVNSTPGLLMSITKADFSGHLIVSMKQGPGNMSPLFMKLWRIVDVYFYML